MKRKIALFLAAACIVSISGCGNGTNTETVQKVEMNEPGTFPISKEKIKLTVGVEQNQTVEDWETNALTKELEEKAGVELEFEIFPAADAASKVAARVASQTALPDIMSLANTSLESHVTSGAFLPVTEYYNNPNMAYYFNQRVANDERKRISAPKPRVPTEKFMVYLDIRPKSAMNIPIECGLIKHGWIS